MAKMAKLKQTDYSKGGHAVSETAVPYWQNALGYMNDYLSDPKSYINSYLEEYYSPDSASQKDFDRQYLNTMSRATANNYASTHGGYSSAGQKSWADLQRNENDLKARMREQGISSAADMAQNWFNSALSATPAYQNAWGAGKTYGDIDQYNNIRHQNNSFGNQALSIGSELTSGAGQVFSSIPLPWTQALGAGLQSTGALMGSQVIDPSQALTAAGLGGTSGGTQGSGSNQWSNMAKSVAGGIGATAKMGNFDPNGIFGKLNSGTKISGSPNIA